MKNLFKKIFFISLIFFLFFGFIFGQESSTSTPQNLSPTEERKILEEELKKVLEEIKKLDQEIAKTEKEKRTLQNEIYLLKRKIARLDLQIRENELTVKTLTIQIGETEKSIEKTSDRIEKKREQIASILRTIYEEDQKSFLEILLLESSLSDFFDSLNRLEILYSENQKLLDEIKDLKSSLEVAKLSLDEEKSDMEKLLTIQNLQKRESEEIKKEKNWLLEKTKGKESEYQKLLAQKQKRAAEIRARIFELIGVPKAPTFGEAYEIAKYVESLTGVRPAFLLAVLEQESRIGKNVGQCFLKNEKTGEGVRAKTGEKISKVMNPKRDVKPFLEITKKLGRDPFNTLVSCPMRYGWGGAMGPAQFIPSTWQRYENKISEIIKKTPDPWEIKDSFLATALYLADYGAAEKIPEKEWKSAMIYFAGRIDSRFRWYADQVMKRAEEFEKDIKILEGS
jgi:peptidoglycan hydrolase CwlO-like protein